MEPVTQLDGQGAYEAIRPRISRLIENGGFAPALEMLTELSRVLAPDPVLLQDMAHCHLNLGDHDSAMQLTGAAIAGQPDDPALWARLGAMAYAAGHMDLARQALEAALEIRPGHVAALVALNRIAPFARDSQRTRKLRALSRSGRLDMAERANICHAIGVIEAAAGKLPAAMQFFGRAKTVLPGIYHPDMIERRVEAQRRHFPPHDPVASGGAGGRIAFVVGLPRSGTTLVESILLRHEAVKSTGESHALAECLTQFRQACGLRPEQGDDWSWLGQALPGDMARMRQRYLALAGAPAADEATVIVDKTPLNALDMGFASRLFPDARFIFMSRHPLDAGLSNYVTNFTPGFVGAHPYSKRLDSIGHFTRCLYDSLQDYRAKLGPALHVQSYSALVERPEPQIRAMLMHLGLNWDPACLAPEMREGSVRTASAAQVRQPISRAGIGKWRAYEKELAPLIGGLGGWAWIAAWEKLDLDAAST